MLMDSLSNREGDELEPIAIYHNEMYIMLASCIDERGTLYSLCPLLK